MSGTICPILSVVPNRALVDETFKVVVENLPPTSPVTLHSLHHSEDKDFWEAYGHYISDHRGLVNVSEDMSFGGTYSGKEPMGLLWSMRPEPGSRKGLRLRKMNVSTPVLVHISVYSGHVTEGFRKLPPLASALAERWYMAPGVRRIDVREKKMRGTLFIPPGPGPFPGLLDIWGGGGGLVEYRAALLASRGYATLALEYFAPGKLQSANVELDYFEAAFHILEDHPQVISDKVGIFGLSLGAIFAIYLMAESTVIKPRCCVCVSGHHFYPVGETLAKFFKLLGKHFEKGVDDGAMVWKSTSPPAGEDCLSKKVDVGKIKCPVLMVSGIDDQNWPTVDSVEDINQMMQAAGNNHLLFTLKYPGTGHLIEPPFSPLFRTTVFLNPTEKCDTDSVGGQTKPHADAQEDSWRKILAFLHHHLNSSPLQRSKI
ncbi:peroxisomal succinyl-coenzyme A thioesterase-like [Cheilinus undulatus]|uniref:peroxisomal succinyl-coenzyme A thioesterase-like n=1 Tax=Cheilinus undulatus TaxID=241271 RepID=UPI001BD66BCF|nr:peroxisomal succinyl-coenzyme A thioesterase-like [Cheilinus undulatus]